MKPILMRLMRQPLLHFLVAGAALFAVYALVDRNADNAPDRIVVTNGQIANLASGFSRVWRRPPTPDELAGLVRDHVREEVYYREAMAMGLGRDDTIIRRRLQQKLEFVSEDVGSLTEPSDGDLRAFLAAHPEKFLTEQRVSFVHVYLDPHRRVGTLPQDAADLLARLTGPNPPRDVSTLGDAFLLEDRFDAVPMTEVRKLFGDAFADALSGARPGEWHGPVPSGYGQHLIFVSQRTEPRLPDLEEVRESVRAAWADAQRRKLNEAFYQRLLARYDVVIEGHAVSKDGDVAAANRISRSQP